MSRRTVEYLLCDAPRCPAEVVLPESWKLPDGWIWLRSSAHIPDRIKATRTKLSSEERSYGSFRLSLCPEHPNAFDGHRPQTEGGAARRGKDPIIQIGCECGAKLSWTTSCYLVGQQPSHSPERVWWLHLPEELRWYVHRPPVVSGKDETPEPEEIN